ncbi:MAG: hypothetical protein GY820_18850 [Gammaproteobacteria bacterium]|nr:hypothetical protein [Gammaproteobacteria bacterium]
MKEYKATFRSMIGLTFIVTLLSLFSVYIGVYGNELILVLLGFSLALLLLVIRFRFKVKFDENTLTSTGFFSTNTLKWSEIRMVVNMLDYGYPKNKFYGSSVYEFQAPNKSIKINFKLFPIECSSEIMGKLKS